MRCHAVNAVNELWASIYKFIRECALRLTGPIVLLQSIIRCARAGHFGKEEKTALFQRKGGFQSILLVGIH